MKLDYHALYKYFTSHRLKYFQHRSNIFVWRMKKGSRDVLQMCDGTGQDFSALKYLSVWRTHYGALLTLCCPTPSLPVTLVVVGTVGTGIVFNWSSGLLNLAWCQAGGE